MNQCKKIIGLLCFVFITTIAVAQKTVKKFIKKYESLAVEKSKTHQIPASIILGVSMVESDAGRSIICKSLNNYFGVKGANKSSQKKMGYQSAYKEYKTAAESFEHFCQIVKKKRFYQKLKGNTDYKEWLKQMNQAEYAAAKQKWIDHIIKTIKVFNLTQYDKESAASVATIY